MIPPKPRSDVYCFNFILFKFSMWVEFFEFFVSSRLCSEGFSPGSPVFLPPQKTNISKFQLDLESVPN